jgi:hypothetical protein
MVEKIKIRRKKKVQKKSSFNVIAKPGWRKLNQCILVFFSLSVMSSARLIYMRRYTNRALYVAPFNNRVTGTYLYG